MLFLRTIAFTSILAVGGASESFDLTRVGSRVPSNKPDGRVIFGVMPQHRSLRQDSDSKKYHRKAESNLNLADLIRCNHDDPCGQSDLTTIIIGGGGTLPPKVSYYRTKHAVKPKLCRVCILMLYSLFTLDFNTHSPCRMRAPIKLQLQCSILTRLSTPQPLLTMSLVRAR